MVKRTAGARPIPITMCTACVKACVHWSYIHTWELAWAHVYIKFMKGSVEKVKGQQRMQNNKTEFQQYTVSTVELFSHDNFLHNENP